MVVPDLGDFSATSRLKRGLCTFPGGSEASSRGTISFCRSH